MAFAYPYPHPYPYPLRVSAVFSHSFLFDERPESPIVRRLRTVRWCNGSTGDSDSPCLGSNPSRTISESKKPSHEGFFMPIEGALAGVPEDEEVLGLAAGDDELGLAVTIEVGGLEVFDGDLLVGDDARTPSLAGVVERGE